MARCAPIRVTEATGAGTTVSVAVPLRPSLVALIVVVPTAIAVTEPFAATDAIDVLLDVQVNVRSLSADPRASRADFELTAGLESGRGALQGRPVKKSERPSRRSVGSGARVSPHNVI